MPPRSEADERRVLGDSPGQGHRGLRHTNDIFWMATWLARSRPGEVITFLEGQEGVPESPWKGTYLRPVERSVYSVQLDDSGRACLGIPRYQMRTSSGYHFRSWLHRLASRISHLPQSVSSPTGRREWILINVMNHCPPATRSLQMADLSPPPVSVPFRRTAVLRL